MSIAVCALALYGSGCSPFSGYHAADDAGVEMSMQQDDSPGACTHKRVPVRPQSFDMLSDDGTQELVFAVREVDFGGDADGGTPYTKLGFDLDGVCTAGGKHESCKLPSWGMGMNVNDGSEGQDNSVGAFLSFVGNSALGTYSVPEQVTAAAARGDVTTLIRVTGYNGDTNDPRVSVGVYAATRPLEAGSDDKRQAPAWKGSDGWLAFDEWIADPPVAGDALAPRYSDEHAFVNGWLLVARFEELRISVGKLSGAALVATLVPDGKSWKLIDGKI
ncbi:MAG TPA: hypothetical protein VHM19_05945, partial [Polyangiales bacterium]|nr:hypothetical protein [Polyangiales bacterium]